MEKSKLIVLLKSFNGKNLKRLEEFIYSPFFNTNKDVCQLFNYLKKQYPRFSSKKLQKGAAFKSIFPNREFDKTQFNHLQNYLFRLVEQFIAHQELKEASIEQDRRVLGAYLNARLDKHYQFKRKQYRHSLKEINFKDGDFFFKKYQLSKTENEHFILQKQRVIDPALQDAYDALDAFYIIEKLKFLAQMIDRQKQFPQSYNMQEFEFLDRLIQEKKLQNLPSVLIYRQLIIMLMEEGELVHFDTFRALLDQYEALIPPKELKRLFLFAINYCVRKIATGQKFHQNLLNLYYSGLENGTLLDFGLLSPWTYKNVVQLALALGQSSWVEQFIEQYSKKLPANFQEDAYFFSLATLYYSKKDYEQAMTYLNRVQYSDISYKLWSKELLLKIYYESEAFEALYSLLISFEQLIKRNKQIAKNQREAFRNFLRITSKLMKLRKSKEKLRQEILTAKYVRERQWLLDQLG